jgi:predicted ATPase
MLGNKRFIRSLRLENFLSFGPGSAAIELESLNVLIGPNGAGKSNLIEAIGLLAASATDLPQPIRAGGGVREWLWKGGSTDPVAEMDATIYNPERNVPLRHKLSFTATGSRFELLDEAIENESPLDGYKDVFFYYRYQKGYPVISVQSLDGDGAANGIPKPRNLQREELAPDQSVISQRRDPDLYPEITYLGNSYARIKLFREWNLGRNTPARRPQQVDAPNDFLAEDASNLALVLNRLESRHYPAYQRITELLAELYAPFKSIHTAIDFGTVQLFLREKHLREPIPATRLSDGTLRYLCLLAVLCHPTPPPLICIEEPEIGLHPDMLSTIANLLIEASHRTQLIVTTHSDILIDALSETPEAVIVCEKEDGATQMRRLQPERLKVWLKEYSLGGLWLSGEVGGNRW